MRGGHLLTTELVSLFSIRWRIRLPADASNIGNDGVPAAQKSGAGFSRQAFAVNGVSSLVTGPHRITAS